MSKSKEPLVAISCIILIAGMLLSTLYCIYIINSNKNIITQLESDNSNMQNEIEELQGQVDNLQSKLSSTEGSLKSVQARLKNAEATITARETELATQKTLASQYREEALTWKDKYMNSDPANVTYSYAFTSVNALIAAIKKNPEAYHNVQVKVYGMILAYEDTTYNRKAIALMDYKGESLPSTYGDYLSGYLWRKKSEVKEAIEVNLSSDLQYTVAETGEYVNLYGIVKITNGEIYLDKCQYN